MVRHTVTWTAAEASAVADRWEDLVVARPDQADIYATHAWFDAWLRSEPHLASRVVVHAVLDDGVPVAIWPLVRRRGTWSSTNAGNAPRTRVIVGSDPDEVLLDALVGQAVDHGLRRLRLHGMPTRDPATDLLVGALARRGYAVDSVPGEHDNVVRVAGNEEFDRTVRKLVSSTRPRERRVTPYWDVHVQHYGGTNRPLADGIARFEQVQARSWKGPHAPGVARRRQWFLESADRRGWVHLLMLDLAGQPAAGNVWFRIGDVAVGWSTCYDQRLGSLAPGQLLHRQVQESVRDTAPALLDVLPGDNPFKDSLSVERPPLLTVTAHRGSDPSRYVMAGADRLREPVRTRVRGAIQRVRGLRGSSGEPAAEPVAPAAPTRVQPAATSDQVTVLDTDAAFARYLAVALGLPGAEAAATGWGPEDRWLLVGDARALVRLATADGGTVVEVVPLADGVSANGAAATVAAALGAPVWLAADAVRVTGPPPLPWVPTLATAVGPLTPRG